MQIVYIDNALINQEMCEDRLNHIHYIIKRFQGRKVYLVFTSCHRGGSTCKRFFTKKSKRLCSPNHSPMVW